jgi:hypothetical protein
MMATESVCPQNNTALIMLPTTTAIFSYNPLNHIPSAKIRAYHKWEDNIKANAKEIVYKDANRNEGSFYTR